MGEAMTVGGLCKFQLCKLLLPELKCRLNKIQRRAWGGRYTVLSFSIRQLAVDEIQLREYNHLLLTSSSALSCWVCICCLRLSWHCITLLLGVGVLGGV